MLKEQPTVVDQHDHPQAPQPVSPTKALETGEATKSSEIADSEKAASSNKVDALKSELKSEVSPQPSAAGREPVTANAGEHLTDLATINRFKDLQDQWFADHLKLSNNGKPVVLSKVSVEPAARHPYSVLVKFQFSLYEKAKKAMEDSPVVKESSVDPRANSVASRAVDFQVADNLFADYSGAVRYSLRARGSTMLLRSNVAPVLVRAERVEVEQKTATGKQDSPAIRAKLTIGSQ